MGIICNHCGKMNKKISNYCNGCGSELLCMTGEKVAGRYEIIELIKTSSFGAVYKAKDNKLGISCIIKELFQDPNNQSALARFKREAEILASLKHKSLPGVIDHFVLENRCYLIMDYVDGENLLTILKRSGSPGLSEEKVIEWAIQILKVLEYLHSQDLPIIYRDLKPSNIMLHKNGRIMLIDFGIARTINPGSETKKTAIGTDGYAPAEQYLGKIGPRSDIYALGATMHHLLTGKEPERFKFTPLKKTNPHISKELDNIVIKALKYKMSERFLNAVEMRHYLEKLTGAGIKNKKEAGPVKKRTSSIKNKFSVPGKMWLIPLLLFLCLTGLFLKNFYINGSYSYIEAAEKELDLKNYGTAKKYYEKALKENNNEVEALMGLAKISLKEKNPDSALAYYLKIKALAPKNQIAQKEIFNIYMALKDFKGAEKELKNLEMTEKEKTNKYIELGDIFLKEEDYTEAANCLEEALELSPDNNFASQSLSRTYMELKNYDRAIEIHKNILNATGPSTEIYRSLGEASYELENFEEAHYWFGEALKLNEKRKKTIISMNIKCFLKQGEAELEKGNLKEAEEFFRNALELDEECIEAKEGLARSYLNLGINMFNEGRMAEARVYFDKVILISIDETIKDKAKYYIAQITSGQI